MAAFSSRDIARLGPWARGANNVAREDSLPPSSARAMTNVDIYPGGKVRRRGGSAPVATQPLVENLWSDGHYALCTSSGSLYRFVPGQPLQLLASGIEIEADVAYCAVNQFIYASDTQRALRVDTTNDSVVPWGVPTPLHNPALTATANGGMAAGAYQVAITYARADGEESGATLSESIDVLAGGGIALSGFPPAPSADVTTIVIYRTTANGTEEAYTAAVPSNVVTAQLFDGALGRALTTQLLSPMPAGRAAAFTCGRLFVAVGNAVCWSEPLQYGLTNIETNYAAFSADVAMIVAASPAAQSQGVFVGTGATTYFLRGTDTDEFINTIAYHAGAVPGSAVLVSGAFFEDDTIPNVPVPVWVATNGAVCAGLPDGSVKPLTEGRFAMSTGDRASSLVREINGIRQMLVTMRPPAHKSVFAASDSVAVTRIKNGIVVL